MKHVIVIFLAVATAFHAFAEYGTINIQNGSYTIPKDIGSGRIQKALNVDVWSTTENAQVDISRQRVMRTYTNEYQYSTSTNTYLERCVAFAGGMWRVAITNEMGDIVNLWDLRVTANNTEPLVEWIDDGLFPLGGPDFDKLGLTWSNGVFIVKRGVGDAYHEIATVEADIYTTNFTVAAEGTTYPFEFLNRDVALYDTLTCNLYITLEAPGGGVVQAWTAKPTTEIGYDRTPHFKWFASGLVGSIRAADDLKITWDYGTYRIYRGTKTLNLVSTSEEPISSTNVYMAAGNYLYHMEMANATFGKDDRIWRTDYTYNTNLVKRSLSNVKTNDFTIASGTCSNGLFSASINQNVFLIPGDVMKVTGIAYEEGDDQKVLLTYEK